MRPLVERFLESQPRLSSPGGAESQCSIATQALVTQLTAAGVPANPAWVRGHRFAPPQAAMRAMQANRHLIVRVPDAGFVDVTRRQFEPTGTHPRYYSSEADLACDWKEIDDGAFNGTAEQERWRSLGLAKWDLGLSGKGLLLKNGQLRCWSVDADDAPHHHGGLRVLGLEPQDVETYLIISVSGGVRLPDDASHRGLAQRIAAADSRLRTQAPTGWHFELRTDG